LPDDQNRFFDSNKDEEAEEERVQELRPMLWIYPTPASQRIPRKSSAVQYYEWIMSFYKQIPVCYQNISIFFVWK
jgi:hypothetical protein